MYIYNNDYNFNYVYECCGDLDLKEKYEKLKNYVKMLKKSVYIQKKIVKKLKISIMVCGRIIAIRKIRFLKCWRYMLTIMVKIAMK